MENSQYVDFSYVTWPPAPPVPPPGPPSPPPGPPSAADYTKQVRMLLDNLDSSVGRVMRERDEARAEIARARAETVRAMDGRDAARRAEHEATRLLVKAGIGRDEATKRADAAESALTEAQSKIIDIGWRKNRLLDAIIARGFIVEWAKDGTPSLLTKEEIAKREEEAKRKDASTLTYEKYLSQMLGVRDDSLLGKYMMTSLSSLGGFNLLTSPYVQKDKVLFWDNRGVTAPGVIKVRYEPEDRVISQQPAKPAERTAEDYYRAAIKAVWGYQVSTEAVKRASDHMKGLVDAALRKELRAGYPSLLICPDENHCRYSTCTIFRERPWAKTA